MAKDATMGGRGNWSLAAMIMMISPFGRLGLSRVRSLYLLLAAGIAGVVLFDGYRDLVLQPIAQDGAVVHNLIVRVALVGRLPQLLRTARGAPHLHPKSKTHKPSVRHARQRVRRKSRRVRNESQRARHKSQRVRNESQRVRNESQRVRKESQRVRNESQRVRNESQRVRNESQRVRKRKCDRKKEGAKK
jgi:hypothetical protein